MLSTMRASFLKSTLLLLVLVAAPVWAAQISRIEVHGLDDEMTANVREVLSLEDARDKDISDRRLDYLLAVAEAETREALEPFGYYNPTIKISTSGARDALAIVIEVDKGAPVKVRDVRLAITGDGDDDRYLREELDNFVPRKGDVLDHTLYESASGSGFQTWPIDRLLSFFLPPYHRFTRPREKNTAENMLVAMPMQCTTAKPRTTPEPKASRARPTISVVKLESKMVAQARS